MTRNELLSYISGNQGATNNQIAAHFNITPAYAATRTKQLFDKGYIRREVIGHTVTGSEIFGNSVLPVDASMHKKERKAVQKASTPKPVGERLENGGIGEMIQNLSDALAKQIAASVVVSLQASLTRELASVIPQHVPPAKQLTLNLANLPEPAVIKPCLGIVGLLPAQIDVIEKEFGDVFEVRYWKDDGVAALKALGRASEVVLVTKWCNHSATEVLKGVGAKWRFVDGGLTELKTMLTALYVEN
jgi:DNA-binding Lrp family transcriptional regulator